MSECVVNKKEKIRQGRRKLYRQRRQKRRVKEERKATSRDDRSFARTLVAQSKTCKQPHLQWMEGKFVPKYPDPSPMLQVKVTMMHDAHKTLGIHWRGSRRGSYESVNISGLADTGCQTCTAGLDFLRAIGCPDEYMIPTKHQIVGITSSDLGIVGAVCLKIQLNGACSRQLVYISEKVQGFFISEGTLKDLGIISQDFPNCRTSTKAAWCMVHKRGS